MHKLLLSTLLLSIVVISSCSSQQASTLNESDVETFLERVELEDKLFVYVDLYVSLDSGYDYYSFLYEINNFIRSVIPNSEIVLEDLIFTKNPMDFFE